MNAYELKSIMKEKIDDNEYCNIDIDKASPENIEIYYNGRKSILRLLSDITGIDFESID